MLRSHLMRDYLLDWDVRGITRYILGAMLGAGSSKGTLSEILVERLGRFDFYRAFAAGTLSREEFHGLLIRYEEALRDRGLSPPLVRYASRMPLDDRAYVDTILECLHQDGLISTTRYDREEFEAYRRTIRARFAHGCYATSIFPEEERLVFALSEILGPRRLISLGSYYGYWTVWALPAVRERGGEAILIDVDPGVCALADKNLRDWGLLVARGWRSPMRSTTCAIGPRPTTSPCSTPRPRPTTLIPTGEAKGSTTRSPASSWAGWSREVG